MPPKRTVKLTSQKKREIVKRLWDRRVEARRRESEEPGLLTLRSMALGYFLEDYCGLHFFDCRPNGYAWEGFGVRSYCFVSYDAVYENAVTAYLNVLSYSEDVPKSEAPAPEAVPTENPLPIPFSATAPPPPVPIEAPAVTLWKGQPDPSTPTHWQVGASILTIFGRLLTIGIAVAFIGFVVVGVAMAGYEVFTNPSTPTPSPQCMEDPSRCRPELNTFNPDLYNTNSTDQQIQQLQHQVQCLQQKVQDQANNDPGSFSQSLSRTFALPVC